MAKILRSFLLLFLLVSPAVAGDDPLAVRDPQGILSRHPYVQMPTQTSAVIVWRTNSPSFPGVRFGSDPLALTGVVFPTQMTIKLGRDVAGAPDALRLHSAPFGTYQYEALITGLTPDTKVYYAVCDGSDLLAGADEAHYFQTLPVAGTDKPMRLWITGDAGNGSLAQKAAFDAMRNLVVTEDRPVDHYLNLGDMAYNVGLDSEFQANFFNIYRDLLRNTPVWATMGNHEGYTSRGVTGIGPYYDAYAIPKSGECGGVASGSEGYYSFDIGKVHFVVLNSYDLPRAPTGAMAQWLQADLDQADADWLIAFWHHPPYTKGTHNSDTEVELIEMRTHILPILEAAGVDLTLTGHSHIYERSMLIDGAYATPTTSVGVVLDDSNGRPDDEGMYTKSEGLNANEGSVHIVAGNGRSASHFGISPVMRYTIPEVGSVLIDIDGDELKARMLNMSGLVRDWFTLKKSGQVPARLPLKYPWNSFGPEYRMVQLVQGFPQVEILPRPAAPDAAIFYTTDGSVPTPMSLAYTGPFSAPTGTNVQALSVWLNGMRTSPVTSYFVPAFSSGVPVVLAGASDDGIETVEGNVILNGLQIEVGAQMAGFRFENVRIPAGSTVTQALIQFTSDRADAAAASLSIRAELSPDSAPFAGTEFEFSGRSKSNASAQWNVSSWIFGGQRGAGQRTADLSHVLQEVIDAPGWQAGNAMSFFLENSTGARAVRAFEAGASQSAVLLLDYQLGSAFEIAAQTIISLELSGSPGNGSIQLQFPRFKNSAGRGLTYVLESSADLSEGSWVPVADPPTFINPIGSTVFEFVTYRGLPYTEATQFFRLRVSGDVAQ